MASKLVEAGERDEKETREVRVRVEPLTSGASHDKALLLRNTVLSAIPVSVTSNLEA